MNKENNTLKSKLETLISERETIITEMEEIQKAFTVRQQRVIEINGALKVLQDLINNESCKNDSENVEK